MEEFEIRSLINAEISLLAAISENFLQSQMKAHELEKDLLAALLSLGLSMLAHLLKEKTRQLQGLRPSATDVSWENKGQEGRQYVSIFGRLQLTRPSYWSAEYGKTHPVDETLCLPLLSQWSYNLQELVGMSASENDYAESVGLLNKLLGLGLSGKASQRNTGHLGACVDAFYTDSEVAAPLAVENKVTDDQPIVCFSASFDGKGVPKIKPAVTVAGENPKKRLGRGEKRGVMEMATVSVTASFIPKKRDRERILDSLMGEMKQQATSGDTPMNEADIQDNKWHKNIHRRAFLADQEKAIMYGLRRIKSMATDSRSRFVVPIDAGVGLEDKVLAWVKAEQMDNQFAGIILDIIHVSEYTWDAATAIFGEKSILKNDWVRSILADLLDSKTTKVINELEQFMTQKKRSESSKKQLQKTINYFTNHQHKMDYKTFIDSGYPISSALVEAACGHLVKERLEQSGMRWSADGAQHVMDMRAVKLNGDMEKFMQFFIELEHPTPQRTVA
jgi:hemerythrin